ncbi:MAG TPA: NAD-dependent epimerase/dehydratase family protein [Lentimicrobium sp.]|nr:NAD-dependent epimerase/dehydratase family protein [Lentimicrobium sp.]
MQTILGAGGVIGNELARALRDYNTNIRLVSRNPQKVDDDNELFTADLLNKEEVNKAVKGSEVVYLTAGMEYKKEVWKDKWPKVIRNVLDACIAYNAKLVFFDNIYMYDKNSIGFMTEDNPVKPPSEKGKVRALLNKMIFDEVEKGTVKALIARCADYYGPGVINTSMLWQTVIKPLKEKKTANWMGYSRFKHSFTFTPDAGKATALLGNTDDAYNQVWHLPTAKNPLTGKEWVEAFAQKLNSKPKFMQAPKLVVRILSLFIPIMKEMIEMVYQYDRDYVFDSSKFEKRFGVKPTSYEDGIQIVVDSLN